MSLSGYIDLHVHSNVSDGKMSVHDIINLANATNVSVLSLSEHYNMGSYHLAKDLAGTNIEIIPSVEIGASLSEFGLSKKHTCHIIAYYPSYKICTILDQYEESREKCIRKTLASLQKSISLSYNDVLRHARNKNSIGRFDIAIALYKRGYARSPVDAYGEFLELGTAGYVEREKMQATELIKRIRQVNGVPVIAHPKSLKLNFDDTFQLLHSLKQAGLEGIEVFNPHNTDEQREDYLLLCNYFDLLATCGSDFHAIPERNIQLATGIDNNLCISDYSIIDHLKQRQHKIFIQNK